MKAKLSSFLLTAIIASLTTSAEAAQKRSLIPAPPPRAYSTATVPAKVAPAQAPSLVEITPAAMHVSAAAKPQRYTDSLTLQPTQDKLPLKLVIKNGFYGKPSFTWFRLRVNGELLLTEKSLKGKRSASVDVSGAIPVGQNQVVIDAAGVRGAAMSWQLATMPMIVESVEPKTAQPGGKVVIHGQNFVTDTNLVNVVVGDSVGDVISTNATTMTVRLPEDAKGSTTINITANGLPSLSVPIRVAGFPAPTVAGTSMWAAPAGTEITITGKNFSANASDNQVFFDNVAAQVTSAAKDSLKVVVPQLRGATSGQQASAKVFVVSNGIKSNNSVAFTVGKTAVDPNYRPSARFPEQATQNSSQASSMTSSSANFQASSQNSSQAGNQATTNSSSQSAGFTIVSPEDK